MSEIQQLSNLQLPLVSSAQASIVQEAVTALSEPVKTPPPQTDYEIAMAALNSGANPALLVFDCDWTLYPYDCDKHRMAPFSNCPFGEGIFDRFYRKSDPYKSVPAIFGAIADSGIPVAFLSRNPSAFQVRNLLSTIPCQTKVSPTPKTLWDTMPSHHYFHAYSSDGVGSGKDRHFAAIRGVCGTEFKNMLFFDDLPENIVAAQRQGTTSVLLGKSGLSLQAFLAGVEGWRVANKPLPTSGG